MIIGFVGLGLMGGSLAKAVRRYCTKDAFFQDSKRIICSKILATDIHKTVLEDALLDGTADAVFKTEDVSAMLSLCDIVFVCLYPELSLQFILENEQFFKKGSLVTDIAGVKSSFCEGIKKHFKRNDVDIIPAHPMAGSEREGYAHSDATIFKNRKYIIMPFSSAHEKNIEMLEHLIYQIGFSTVIRTSAKNHDHKIAFTSQLCHVIACSLVDSAEDTSITDFGGGSFEDLTRIAMINAPLWTELFYSDKKELLYHIEEFENSLCTLKEYLEKDDKESLKIFLESVRNKRIEMATH